MKFRFAWIVGAALLAGGCAGSSNVTYLKIGAGTPSGFTGTDCPGGGNTITFSGIDGDGTVAIYAEPNNQYFLDPGTGNGLEGTLSGSAYTFTGSWTADDKADDEVQTIETLTLTLTGSGTTYTGTITVQDQCQSSNNDLCGGLNPLSGGSNPFSGLSSGFGSTDSKDFDCTNTESLQAIQVPATQIAVVGASNPTGPSAP